MGIIHPPSRKFSCNKTKYFSLLPHYILEAFNGQAPNWSPGPGHAIPEHQHESRPTVRRSSLLERNSPSCFGLPPPTLFIYNDSTAPWKKREVFVSDYNQVSLISKLLGSSCTFCPSKTWFPSWFLNLCLGPMEPGYFSFSVQVSNKLSLSLREEAPSCHICS